jgi:hypothetical protein
MKPQILLLIVLTALLGCAVFEDYQRTYTVSCSDGKSTISTGIQSK